jgi:hypothetical protein
MKVSVQKEQRNQAFACFILALSMACSVFSSAFGKHDALAFEQTRNSIFVHEKLLRQSKEYLRECQNTLTSLEADINHVKRPEVRN